MATSGRLGIWKLLKSYCRTNWKDYIGTVAEISCMEISHNKDGKPGFRHCRLINLREDKNPKDCLMEQIL